LRAERDPHVDQYLRLQIDRYEAILSEWWDHSTVRHDEKAAGVLLRALGGLDRILRLDQVEPAAGQETVVIAADRDTYIKQLQQVVESRQRRASPRP